MRDAIFDRPKPKGKPKRQVRAHNVFGPPLAPATAPIVKAQRVAHQRVQRAQARLPRRPLPAIPTLMHPTQRQAQTAVQLGRRSVQRQVPRNLPTRERVARLDTARREMLRDPRAKQILRAARIIQRHGLEHVATALPSRPGKPLPAPFTQVDPLYRDAVIHPRGLPTGRAQRIVLGRKLRALQLAQAVPGRHTEFHVPGTAATIDFTGLRQAVSGLSSVARAPEGERNLFKRSMTDLGLLGTGPVVAGWEIGQGTLEAAKGIPGVGALLNAAHGAPVVGHVIPEGHGTGRLGHLASGVASGVKEEITHPGKAFTEHPLLTALDAAALFTGVGRLAGAAARVGTAGRVASTVRPPLALSDDAGAVQAGLRHERTGSKDVTRMWAQRAADARREPLRDAQGNVVTVTDRGKTVPVLRTTPAERERLLRRRGNFVPARANAVERLQRDVTGRAGKVRGRHVTATRGGRVQFQQGIRGGRARDVVAMVAQGTITSAKHFKTDLEAHARRLEDEYQARIAADPKGYRHSEEAQANRDRLATVQAVLADPKAMAQSERIAAAGIEHGRRLTANDRALMERKVLAEGSGYRSRLMHTAIEHMGARHFTVEEHRRLERAAGGRERTAAQTAVTLRQAAKETSSAPERAALLNRAAAAEREFHAARAERIAVSGRHPERVRAHEATRAEVAKAELAVKAARAEHLKAHNEMTRVRGVQSVQRGGEAAKRMEIASGGGRRAQHVLRYIDEALGQERKVAAREDFIRDRPGAVRDLEARPLEELTRNVKPQGRRGYSIENEHMQLRYADGEHAGWGDQIPGSKVVVYRDAQGRIQGALHMKLDERGRPESVEVAVAPGARGKGVGSGLYDYAQRRGFDVESASGRHGLTEAGAALQHKRLTKRSAGAEARLARGAAKETRMERQHAAADRKLAAAKLSRQRAEKALRKARHRLRENPMPETQAALRLPGGRFLSNKAIEDFLRSRGRDPETVAFLPSVSPSGTGLFGRRAHHTQMRVDQRPNFDKQRLTGEQYRKGATAATADLLRDQGVRQATQLAKAEQIDKFIGESVLRHPAWAKARAGEQLTKAEQRIVNRGGGFTGAEAAETIDRLAADTGEEYVAVRMNPGGLTAETQRAIRDIQNPQAMESLGQRLFNDRIVAPEELGQVRARNVGLAPAELVRQMNAHLQPAGEIERAFQIVNRAFRLSVLPQPRWLTGNFVEPYFVRLPMIGSGVVNIPGLAVDWAAARKGLRIMKESDDPRMQQLAREIEGQQFGGMLLGGRGAGVRRTRDDFKIYGHIVRKLPAVEQFADLGAKILKIGTAPLDAILRANRPLIEAPTQRAAFGRSLRHDIQELSGSWMETVRLGDKAVREAVEGLVNTSTQERFMRSQHELLGKYEGYGPTVRRLIGTIAPFAPWALSAARFVYFTMPIHHTAKTALLLKTQQVVSDEWNKEHADVPPGGLRGAARTKDGGFIDFARYGPYGLTLPIVEGDWQGPVGELLPQVSGFTEALRGKDPFGRDLRVAPTPDNPRGIPSGGQKFGIGVNTLLESLIPYLATGRRLREHGETSVPGSTILSPKTKPGTSHGMSAFERTFDPFRPTYLHATSSGQVVKPTGATRPARKTQAQRDADLVRQAVHGPAASGISSEDLDLIRRATRP